MAASLKLSLALAAAPAAAKIRSIHNPSKADRVGHSDEIDQPDAPAEVIEKHENDVVIDDAFMERYIDPAIRAVTAAANATDTTATAGDIVAAAPTDIITADSSSGGIKMYKTRFLLAHDSATGFMGSWDVRDAWMKTQSTVFIGQLDCGARALDLRVGFQDAGGPLKFHHGGLYMADQTVAGEMGKSLLLSLDHLSHVLPYLKICHIRCNSPRYMLPLSLSLPEPIKQWAASNPEELVLLLVSHCLNGSGDCINPDFTTPFSSSGIKFVTDHLDK